MITEDLIHLAPARNWVCYDHTWCRCYSIFIDLFIFTRSCRFMFHYSNKLKTITFLINVIRNFMGFMPLQFVFFFQHYAKANHD